MTEHVGRNAEDGPAPLPPGACIAPGYLAIELLRRGNTLDVYDVWSEERDCRCVAKMLRPDRRTDRVAREQLRREGLLLIGFSHPHLVRAYELIDGPSPVLILETLTGETLGHLIRHSRRRVSVHDAAFLGLHLCSALHYLHRHNVLHLDIKPSNIMLECGTAKLMDLSIARPPGRGRRGIGTPHYMAPEQARGGMLSAATDVWGVGVVLFEAITGSRPLMSNGTAGAQPGTSIRTYRRVPRLLAQVVEECLAPLPADRPAVNAVAASLRQVSGSGTSNHDQQGEQDA